MIRAGSLVAVLYVLSLLSNGSSYAAEREPGWDDRPPGDAKPERRDDLSRPPTPPRPPQPKGFAPGNPNQPGDEGLRPNRMGPGFPGGRPPGVPPEGSFMPFGPPFRFGGPFDSRQWEQLKESDPELYELEKNDDDLERKTMELAQQFRRASADQKSELKKQISELVTRHFEVRQARRQLHLKRLQEELEQLRGAIERRNEMRGEIVGRRVAELTGASSELDF